MGNGPIVQHRGTAAHAVHASAMRPRSVSTPVLSWRQKAAAERFYPGQAALRTGWRCVRRRQGGARHSETCCGGVNEVQTGGRGTVHFLELYLSCSLPVGLARAVRQAVQRTAHTGCMTRQIVSAVVRGGVASIVNGYGGVAELGISKGSLVFGAKAAHCSGRFVGFGYSCSWVLGCALLSCGELGFALPFGICDDAFCRMCPWVGWPFVS